MFYFGLDQPSYFLSKVSFASKESRALLIGLFIDHLPFGASSNFLNSSHNAQLLFVQHRLALPLCYMQADLRCLKDFLYSSTNWSSSRPD